MNKNKKKKTLDGGPNSLNMLYTIVFILFSYYIVLLVFGFLINFINLKIKCNFPQILFLPLILVCYICRCCHHCCRIVALIVFLFWFLKLLFCGLYKIKWNEKENLSIDCIMKCKDLFSIFALRPDNGSQIHKHFYNNGNIKWRKEYV